MTHKDRTPVQGSGVQMLAFTVQFSRYGRNRSVLSPPSGEPFGRAVRVSALSEAAASSGPNSVLGTSTSACSSFRSSPQGRAY
jgi:hypothetical protein